MEFCELEEISFPQKFSNEAFRLSMSSLINLEKENLMGELQLKINKPNKLDLNQNVRTLDIKNG